MLYSFDEYNPMLKNGTS